MPDATIPTHSVRYSINVRMLHPNGRGHGARKGHVMHAVEPEADGQGYMNRAICGHRPSYDWSEPHEGAVTCPKCLRKIAKLQEAK
jgi:hypothetical protein